MLVLSSSAFSKTWTINRDHSEILFLVPYLKVAELTGRFNSFTGGMDLPEGKEIPTMLDVEIASGSIDTGNKMRDGHLRGSEFFASQTHPHITFQSEDIKKTNSGFAATGTLTIRGVSRPHTFTFTLAPMMKDTWGYENRMVRFETELDRTNFNMSWNKTLEGKDYLIGDKISIRGTFQMQPAQGVTPKSKHMLPDTSYIRSRERVARGEESAVKIETPVVVPRDEIVRTIVKEKDSSVTHEKEGHSLYWWLSFGVLGMFGFVGVALAGIGGKKALLKAYAHGYEETGRLGLLSDLVVIAVVLLYSYALWVVGWEF